MEIKKLTKINLAVIGQVGLNQHFDLPLPERLSEHLLPRPPLLWKSSQRERPRHFHVLHSLRPLRRRIKRVEQRNLILILLLLQRRLSCPRSRHRRRLEGQECRLADGQGLHLGRLGVAVLELEGRAGEEVRHAGLANDDGAVPVGGYDSVLDGLKVFGAAVNNLEGWVGSRFLGFLARRRRIFWDRDKWGGRGRGGNCGVLWGWR